MCKSIARLGKHLFIATTISLLPFAAQAQFSTVGSAGEVAGKDFRLTENAPGQTGAVWYKKPIILSHPFSVKFRLLLGCNDEGGEGVAFVLQQAGEQALGQGGSGLGYKGLSPSIAVEFDSRQNEFETYFEQNVEHIAVVKNGNPDHLASTNLAGPVKAVEKGNAEDCQNYDAQIVWTPQPALLEVFFDGKRRIALKGDEVLAAFGGSPVVYWGFTAATDAKPNVQEVQIGVLQLTTPGKPPLGVNLGLTHPLCEDEASGAITALPSGGAGGYTYKWSNGSTQGTIRNLPTGSYSLTLTDVAGNTLSKQAMLEHPNPLELSAVRYYKDNNSGVPWQAVIEGGTPPYKVYNGFVSFSNGGMSGFTRKEVALNVGAKMEHLYIDHPEKMRQSPPLNIELAFVEVMDANGCQITRYFKPPAPAEKPKPAASVPEVVLKKTETKTVDPTVNPNKSPRGNGGAARPVPKPEPEQLHDLKLTYTTRNIPDSLGQRKVKTGKRVLVRGSEITINVWDSGKIDGDTISLFFNGEWLLKAHPLKRKKTKINVRVSPNADNYLILYAQNEGKNPPNTAALSIYDGKSEKQVALSSDMKHCDALKFEFVE